MAPGTLRSRGPRKGQRGEVGQAEAERRGEAEEARETRDRQEPRLCPGRARRAPRRSPLTRPPVVFHREDAVAPECKASGRGSRVTHLLGHHDAERQPLPAPQVRLRPCGGPEDVAPGAPAPPPRPPPAKRAVPGLRPGQERRARQRRRRGPRQSKDGLLV